MPPDRIDGDADAPVPGLRAVGIARAAFHQRLDARPVQIAAHDSHAFAIAPVQLAGLLRQLHLLGRVGASLRHDGAAMAAVQVDALDGAVVDLELPMLVQ
jgi:hypothetical protein